MPYGICRILRLPKNSLFLLFFSSFLNTKHFCSKGGVKTVIIFIYFFGQQNYFPDSWSHYSHTLKAIFSWWLCFYCETKRPTLYQQALICWSPKIHTWKGNLGSNKRDETMVQLKKLPFKKDNEIPSSLRCVLWAVENCSYCWNFTPDSRYFNVDESQVQYSRLFLKAIVH